MRPTLRTLFLHGGDILKSPGMQIAKENMQHGSVSVFEHSVCVALCCTIIFSTIGTRPTPRTGCTGFGTPERLCAMPTATLS